MKGPSGSSKSCHSITPSGVLALAFCALATPALAQTPRTWTAGSGVWSNPLNWSPNDVPNAPPETAVIGGAGALTATLDIPALLVGASITNPSATLAISPGLALALGTPGLNTGLVNNGLLRVNSTGAPSITQLRFPAGAVITGSGRIQLGAHPASLDNAFISADPSFSWTNSTGHTISGTGRLYGPIINQGTIDADQVGQILQIAGDVQNTGALSATIGILEIAQGARLSGGSLAANAGTLVRVTDQAGMASMTLGGSVQIASGARLEIGAGSLAGNFDLKVNDAGTNLVSEAVAVAPATLGGGGTSTTTLNANPSDLDSAFLGSESGTLTIGSGHTIRGTGRIYAPLAGSPTINANFAGRELEVLADIDMTGGGSMTASAANAVLSLGNSLSLTGGTFGSSAGGIARIRSFASPLLQGTALSGTVEVQRGATLRFAGATLANAGTLLVNSTAENTATGLFFTQTAQVNGPGGITLNASSADPASSQIGGAPAAGLINGSDHTIRGTGRISLPIQNLGAISANNPAGPLQLAAGVSNAGTGATSASNAPLQILNGMTLSGGSFSSFGTGRLSVPQGETATLHEFTIKPGAIAHAMAGGSLLISSVISNSGQVVINPAGDLQLTRLRAAASASLSGTGSVLLNANSSNLDSAMIDSPGFSIQQGAQHSITGQGRIYASMVNSGLIAAGSAGQSLEVVGQITQDATGRLRAGAGTLALRSGATVTGGEFDRTASGRLTVNGSATATGIRSTTPIDVLAGSAFSLSGFTNDNEIVVNPTSDAPLTRIAFAGTQTLLGTGFITLNAQSNPTVRARLDGPAAPDLLTLGPTQTLRGSGAVGGNVRIDGTIAPGAAGTGTGQIVFERGPGLLPATLFDLNFAGPAAYDSIAVQQPYALAGLLKVTLTGGYNPISTHLFTVIDGSAGATRTNGFTSFNLPTPPPSPLRRAWRLNYLPEDVTIRLTCAADFNGDGFVNDLDFQYFLYAYDNLICPTPDSPMFPLQPDPCPADLNMDDLVLDDDFVLFVQAYNLVICQ